MAEFDPSLHISQDFDPQLHVAAGPTKPRGYTKSALTGIPEALWGTWAKGASLAAAAPAMGVDALRGLVSGKTETGAQDWVFENMVDASAQKAQQYALTPEEAANPAKAILHGIGGVVPTLVAAGATRGMVGGKELAAQTAAMLPAAAAPWMLNAAQGVAMMAPTGVIRGAASATDKITQGASLDTAYKIGAIDAAGAVVEGALPAAVTGKLATRVASGAGINVVAGEGQRMAQNAVLDANPELKRDFSVQEAAVNAATGALFGGIFGPRPLKTQIAADTAALKEELDPAPKPEMLRLGHEDLNPSVAYPDGTLAHPGDIAKYLAGLPDDQARMEARARLYGTPSADIIDPDITARLAKAPVEGEAPPFVETIPAKSQQHVEDMAAIRDAGEVPTGIPQQDRARADALYVGTKVPQNLDGHLPTAMELALRAAQQARAVADAKLEAQTAQDSRAIAAAAAKEADLAAIQNITKGRELAEAAARGEVPTQAVELRMPPEHFTQALKEVVDATNLEAAAVDAKPVQKGLVTRISGKVAAAIKDESTLDGQLAAIEKLRDANRKNAPSLELLGKLYDNLSEGRTKPNETAPTVEAAQTVKAEAPPEAPANPAADAFTALARAYGDETRAIAAFNRIQDEANAADKSGIAPTAEVIRRAHAEAEQVTTAKGTEGTFEAALQAKRVEAQYTKIAEVVAKQDQQEVDFEVGLPPAANDAVQTPKQIEAARVVALKPAAPEAPAAAAPAAGKITADAVHSVRKDDFYGPHSVVTLSDGNTVRIKLMGETESNGHPGWHDLTADEPSRLSLLGANKAEAVQKLLQRANPLEAAADDGLRVNPLMSKVRPEVMTKVTEATTLLARMDMEYSAMLDAQRETKVAIPPEEKARYAAAAELANAIERALNPKSNPPSNAYLNDLALWAKDYATPKAYAAAKASGILAKHGAGELPHPVLGIMLESATGPVKVSRLLQFLDEDPTLPAGMRELARELLGMDTGATIGLADTPPNVAGSETWAGWYDRKANHISIPRTGASPATVLHEVLHSATHAALYRAASGEPPRNQIEARQQKAFAEWEKLRLEAQARQGAADHYGLTDAHEFMAELHTNPKFQEFLRSKGLWAQVVEAIRKLLGLEVNSRTDLDKAMDLSREFFGKDVYDTVSRNAMEVREFNSSPRAAAEVVDRVLPRIIKEDTEAKLRAGIARFPQVVAQKLLPAETVQFMANWVRTNPVLRAVGFDKGVDGYLSAIEARQLAGVYASADSGKVSGEIDAMLRAMPEADARALDKSLSEITTGSSIGGFDPTLNFADNLRVRPGLLKANKGYIDDIHRKFTQLERTNPEAAKLVVRGAQANRKEYVLGSSAVISNLLNAVTGNAVRLETELAGMSKTDADYARMEARVKTAQAETEFALEHAPGLDYMAQELRTAPNGDPRHHLDGASFTLDRRLQSAFMAAAEGLPAGSTLRAQLGEWATLYYNQIENPYYHAGRSGDYFVNVGWKNMDDATWGKMQEALAGTNKILGSYVGQDHAYLRVDTASQASGLRAKLEQAMGNYADIGQSLSGKQSDSAMLNNPHSGISAALRSMISTLDDNIGGLGFSPEQAAKMREMMTRKILSMLPETSARLATIKRIGVPGYDADFRGNFARHAMSAAYDTANVYSMRAYSSAFTTMDAAVRQLSESRDIKNQEYAQAVSDEVKTRYNNSLMPVDSKVVNVINAFGYGFYLGLAPAYLIRNTLQTWHRGLPHLGSRHGFAASVKALGAASIDARNIIVASAKQGWKEGGVAGVLDTGIVFKNLGLHPDVEAFVLQLHDLGRLDLGQAKQLQTMAMGGNTKLNDAVRMVSLVSTYSEMFNRLAMGIAAFNLAQKGKPNFIGEQNTTASAKYAIDAIDFALDNFDPNNTARILSKHAPVTGKITPLMTMFMQYNMQAMQQIARTVHDGLFSQDSTPTGMQRAAEARKEFAGLMATTTMLAGALGLPFANLFAGIYNTLTNDDDAPSDIRQDARNGLANTLGVTIGGAVAHGPLNALGVDTGTLGMQNIFPGTEFLVSRRLLADRWKDLSENLMGPALNAGLDITAAMADFSDGNYTQGIVKALPSALKGYWKAGQLASRGYTDARGNPLGLDATGWDIAQQAVGFRPGNRAETAEASYYFQANQARLNHRKQVITDQFFKAYTFGDSEDQQAATEAVTEFNEKNPMQPIRDIASVFRQRAIQEATGRASGTGVGVPVRQLPILMQQTQFVDHGGMPAR